MDIISVEIRYDYNLDMWRSNMREIDYVYKLDTWRSYVLGIVWFYDSALRHVKIVRVGIWTLRVPYESWTLDVFSMSIMYIWLRENLVFWSKSFHGDIIHCISFILGDFLFYWWLKVTLIFDYLYLINLIMCVGCIVSALFVKVVMMNKVIVVDRATR